MGGESTPLSQTPSPPTGPSYGRSDVADHGSADRFAGVRQSAAREPGNSPPPIARRAMHEQEAVHEAATDQHKHVVAGHAHTMMHEHANLANSRQLRRPNSRSGREPAKSAHDDSAGAGGATTIEMQAELAADANRNMNHEQLRQLSAALADSLPQQPHRGESSADGMRDDAGGQATGAKTKKPVRYSFVGKRQKGGRNGR